MLGPNASTATAAAAIPTALAAAAATCPCKVITNRQGLSNEVYFYAPGQPELHYSLGHGVEAWLGFSCDLKWNQQGLGVEVDTLVKPFLEPGPLQQMLPALLNVIPTSVSSTTAAGGGGGVGGGGGIPFFGSVESGISSSSSSGGGGGGVLGGIGSSSSSSGGKVGFSLPLNPLEVDQLEKVLKGVEVSDGGSDNKSKSTIAWL
jgi:hypothetical protein